MSTSEPPPGTPEGAASTPDKPGEAHKALAVLAEMLEDPAGRRQIAQDPVAALSSRDRDFSALPQAVQDFFKTLSEQELTLLARLQGTMKPFIHEGLAEDVQINHPGAMGKL